MRSAKDAVRLPRLRQFHRPPSRRVGLVLLGMLCMVMSAAPAQAASVTYVAIGDSYSSGEGTRSYDAGGGQCHRGSLAWPRRLNALSSRIGPIRHRACTGATSLDLFRTYKGTIQVVPSKPDRSVGLVTVTIGGNDVNFRGLVQNCFALIRIDCLSSSHMWDYQNSVDRLRARLINTVYPKLRAAFPKAVIVHVGYPEITPEPGKTPVRCGWLSKAEQNRIGMAARYLNNSLKIAAGESRKGIRFVPTLDTLDGHELCTANSWVVPIRGLTSIYGTEQAHPTSAGQLAIAKAVQRPIHALL